MDNNKILHVVDLGDTTDSSKVIKAWELPITIEVSFDDTYSDGTIRFLTSDKDDKKNVGEAYIFNTIEKSDKLKNLINKIEIEERIAEQVSEWVVTYLREGKFYLDEERTEYVYVFDLSKVGGKATDVFKNLLDKCQNY